MLIPLGPEVVTDNEAGFVLVGSVFNAVAVSSSGLDAILPSRMMAASSTFPPQPVRTSRRQSMGWPVPISRRIETFALVWRLLISSRS